LLVVTELDVFCDEIKQMTENHASTGANEIETDVGWWVAGCEGVKVEGTWSAACV
jgi:hypothetical protein